VKFSAGRLVIVLLAPVIAGGVVAVVLMLLAIVAAEAATTIDIPYLVTYTGTMDAGGGGRTLRIDGSWTAAAALAAILASPLIALGLFLPD
jgi:hypothetical protein